jgi:hypothetical protein
MEATNTIWKRVVLLAAGASLIGLTSCAVGPDARSQKFDEAQYADLIIRYSTDQTIYRLKPDGRDGAFFRIYDRNQICAEAEQHQGLRQLAVVMIDYVYAPHTERALINQWAADFKALNYQRVVFLRSRDFQSINGLRVVADLQLSQYASFAPVRQGLNTF